MKRTQEEILNRIEYVKRRDIFGFEESDLIAFLDFENAKKHLNKEYVEKVEDGSEKWEINYDYTYADVLAIKVR